MTEKEEQKTIISEEVVQKATFEDMKGLLRGAIREKFIFENGSFWNVDFDPSKVYFDVEYYEYKDGKERWYSQTYSVPYSIDGVTVSLGNNPKRVEKETKYTELKDKNPIFEEDGDINKEKDSSWVEDIIERVFKKFKKEDPIKDITKVQNGDFYIEKFNEEKMISYEPLYTSPDVADAVGEGMTEEESLKMVKQMKEKIEKGVLEFNLFHKVKSESAEWVDCFSNPWPSCFVGEQEVLKSQPVGVLQWKNKEAWELRKQGIIKGPSIEGKAGNRRVVGEDDA